MVRNSDSSKARKLLLTLFYCPIFPLIPLYILNNEHIWVMQSTTDVYEPQSLREMWKLFE